MGDSGIAEVELPGGTMMLVRTQRIDGEDDHTPDADGPSDVGLKKAFDFSAVTASVRGIVSELHDAVKAAKPDKVTVELGFDLTVKGSQLVALLVDGEVAASIKIQLSWGPGKEEIPAEAVEGSKSE